MLPVAIAGRSFFTRIYLERVLAPGVRIGDARVPDEQLPALPRAGSRLPEEAVGAVWNLRRHGVALDPGDEHSRLEASTRLVGDPVLRPLAGLLEALLL